MEVFTDRRGLNCLSDPGVFVPLTPSELKVLSPSLSQNGYITLKRMQCETCSFGVPLRGGKGKDKSDSP